MLAVESYVISLQISSENGLIFAEIWFIGRHIDVA